MLKIGMDLQIVMFVRAVVEFKLGLETILLIMNYLKSSMISSHTVGDLKYGKLGTHMS